MFLYGQSVSWHIHAKHDPACVNELGTVGRCTTSTFTAKQLQTISQSRQKPIHHFGQQVITVEAFQPLYSLLIATVWITCQRNAAIVTIIKKIKINKTTTPPPPPTKKNPAQPDSTSRHYLHMLANQFAVVGTIATACLQLVLTTMCDWNAAQTIAYSPMLHQ